MAQSKMMSVTEARTLVDVGIITMKNEELRAVLKRFPVECKADGSIRYNISRFVDANDTSHYVAIVRAAEQGDISAHATARSLIDDLNPNFVILIGIAGAVPQQEFTLGDVIMATRMYDFTVSAANPGAAVELSTRSEPSHRVVQILAANLAADVDDLGDWNSDASIGMPRPPVALDNRNFRGPKSWKDAVRDALEHYFGRSGNDRSPIVLDGAIGSGSTLVKDPELLQKWLGAARDLKAVEMEIAGVFEAARSIQGDVPVLVIRGLSDVVGFKRDRRWTDYACHSSASFLRAYLSTDVLWNIPRYAGANGNSRVSKFVNCQDAESSAKLDRLEKAAGLRHRDLRRKTGPGLEPNPGSDPEGKFPDVGTLCVGRAREIAWLDAAWADPAVGVAALLAFGGVGKTTLVWNWWLHHCRRAPNTVLRKWSFYRQGTGEHQEAANAFVGYALRTWYGIEPPASSWQQGECLAQHIRQEGGLVLLDGLEPLQFQDPRDPLFGSFKDAAMVALLQELAASTNAGLCICTSRVRLRDLNNYDGQGFQFRDLTDLTPHTGAEYLRVLGVKGSPEERQEASAKFGNHALSLKLLGSYLTVFREGDPLRIDTLPPLWLFADVNQGRHARRMMEGYDAILRGRASGAVLRLLGLFDRPASSDAIASLLRPPVIEGLTDVLPRFGSDAWIAVVSVLKQLNLIEYDETLQSLDCHPLVREFFGGLLKGVENAAAGTDPIESSPAWIEANRRLFEYYAALPIESFPATPADMAPLYVAVQHACEGREYALGWKVYWQRIQRGHPEYFNTNALGAFQAGLASLAGFFAPPWDTIAAGVEEDLGGTDYRKLLEEVGFHLKVLGRFTEAAHVIRSALDAYDAVDDFEHAAINADNLSEAWLLTGRFQQALSDNRLGRDGVPFAELTQDRYRLMQTLCLRGDILLRMGRYDAAEQAFQQAEKIRMEHYPRRQPVRSLYYLDLLADVNRCEELLALADRFRPLLDADKAKPFTGFFYLVEGRALAFQPKDGERSRQERALKLFEDARQLIDSSNLPHLMPRPRIEQARLLVQLDEHRQAQTALDTALAISQSSRISLYQCDSHLGLCQLYATQGDLARARDHLHLAEPMVTAGYGRRRVFFDDLAFRLEAQS
jgi:nucleoside phosphorylase/tetratricopeptide (TPR) repeat protein